MRGSRVKPKEFFNSLEWEITVKLSNDERFILPVTGPTCPFPAVS